VHIEQLLRIATESPTEDFSDETYNQFIDELKKRTPEMRMDL